MAALLALLCGSVTSVCPDALNQPVMQETLAWQPLFRISEPFLYFSIWVLRLSASKTCPPGGAKRWDENLKFGAVLAVVIQIAIDAWFS